MIGAALDHWQDMIHLHHPKREMRIATDADAFLLTIKPVPVRAIVRQLAQVGTPGRRIQCVCPAPQVALFGNALVHQLDRQWRQVYPGPLPAQTIGSHQRGGATAEGIEHEIATVGTGANDPIQQGERLFVWDSQCVPFLL